jgi:deoxycytidylate deaminase
MLINAQIAKFVYTEDYDDHAFVDMFKDAKIIVEKFTVERFGSDTTT